MCALGLRGTLAAITVLFKRPRDSAVNHVHSLFKGLRSSHTGFALQASLSSCLYQSTMKQYIYLFSLYAYILDYFCTDLRTDGFIFSTKGAIVTEAFSHTFLHDLLKKKKKKKFFKGSVISSPTVLLQMLPK